MASPKSNRRKFAICIWVSLQLIGFALFLHPMSPEDFLMLAVADPLETVTDQNGFAMALCFWISLPLLLMGLLGWLDIAHRFKNQRVTKAASALTHAR